MLPKAAENINVQMILLFEKHFEDILKRMEMSHVALVMPLPTLDLCFQVPRPLSNFSISCSDTLLTWVTNAASTQITFCK